MNGIESKFATEGRQCSDVAGDALDHNVLMLCQLRNAIQAGVASGPGVDADGVFDRLERKYMAALGHP
jgi:hypothetical protein